MNRPKCVSNFTQIPNLLIRCKSLSASARMFLIAAISTPDGWKFSEEGMQSAFGFKRAEVRNSVKELISAGILKRKPIVNDRQLLRGYDWQFDFNFLTDKNDDISENSSAQPHYGEPYHGEPYYGEPCHGEPPHGTPQNGDYTIHSNQDSEINTQTKKTEFTTSKHKQLAVRKRHTLTTSQLSEICRRFNGNEDALEEIRRVSVLCDKTNWKGISDPFSYLIGVGNREIEKWNGFVMRAEAAV